MSLEILLDDEQLNKQFAIARVACRPLIENHKLELKNFLAYAALERTISETIILYTGTFKAVKDVLRGSSVITGSKQKDVLAHAVASKGAGMYFGMKTGAIGTGKTKKENDEIDFSCEEKTMASSFHVLNNTIKDSIKFTSLAEAVKTGYDALALGASQAAFMTNHYVSQAIKVQSSYFSFEGLEPIDLSLKIKKKEQVKENGDEKIIKDPVLIKLHRPVARKDIQGNILALDAIDVAVDKLLAYDPLSRINPEASEGQVQTMFLYGESGTGKSMVVEYGITKALEIAKKYDLPFEAVRLQINTSWQDGHVQILRHQLNYITQPDKIRFVLLEEVERIFPSRTKTNNETTTKIIDEFIDLSNQTAYPNYHNYLIAMVSNIPLEVDPAIRRRAREGTYECKGPLTQEEKLIVLKNNLEEKITQGLVQINDWTLIGELAMELHLKGSDLRDISKLAKQYMSSQSRPANYHGLSLSEKQAVIAQNRKIITDKEFKAMMYQIGTTEKRLTDADAVFRMG